PDSTWRVPQRRRTPQRLRHRRREVRRDQGSGGRVSWPDLRLAGLAAGTWLAAVAALHSTVAGAVWLAILAGPLGIVVWCTPAAMRVARRLRDAAVRPGLCAPRRLGGPAGWRRSASALHSGLRVPPWLGEVAGRRRSASRTAIGGSTQQKASRTTTGG